MWSRRFPRSRRPPNGGLVLLPSLIVTQNRELISTTALRLGLPSIYLARVYVASGGLMSYGFAGIEPFRQAATYVDRILKGAKPGELPVQAADQIRVGDQSQDREGARHQRAATLLARADEVIE